MTLNLPHCFKKLSKKKTEAGIEVLYNSTDVHWNSKGKEIKDLLFARRKKKERKKIYSQVCCTGRI